MADQNTTISGQQFDEIPHITETTTVDFVSEEDFNLLKSDIEKGFASQKKILDWTFGFIVAILVVCFIAFVTFMIDAWKFNGEKTEEFEKSIQELKAENSTLKLNEINIKIDRLEKENDELKKWVIQKK